MSKYRISYKVEKLTDSCIPINSTEHKGAPTTSDNAHLELVGAIRTLFEIQDDKDFLPTAQVVQITTP